MRNKRQEQLLSILSEKQDWLTSKQLASLLQVSDRTIRSDIDTINKKISPPPIESNVRKGYHISENAKIPDSVSSKQEIPQTPDERCIYIIQKLLFEVKDLNLTILQGQIYVSGYSIENDLKRIRKMLEPYDNLKLVRNKACISLEGDEISKRRFYRELLLAEVQENFLNLNKLACLYKDFDLVEVKDIFVDVLNQYGYSIKESLFPMLILHAGTSIERMSHANYIKEDETKAGLEDTIEYEISQTFFDRISKRLHIQVREGEIAMFALVIMGRRASNYTSDFVSFRGNWLNTKKLVEETLTQLNSLFGIDYRNDEDLIAGLKMHLYGLIERIKNEVSLENMFLDEIKRKYPLIFEMGICIVSFLEKKLNTQISDRESGFVALHLGAASERMSLTRKYKAVMILPHNQSFSEMCVKKISDMFRDRMEIAEVASYFEQEAVSALEPDLILTTFPIEHKLDIPTISINLFVDSETESNILQALNKLDKKGFQLEFTSHIHSLIKKEHFYVDLDIEDPEKIIHWLCDNLKKAGIVEADFEETVMKREQMSPTSFLNAFAIPHAFGAKEGNSTIAVAQLKNPVKWGVFEVKLVMLFAINEGDQKMIQMFFDWVSNLVSNPEGLEELCSPCTYEQFIDKIILF